jgi:putative ABC transport system substrate-binding protein
MKSWSDGVVESWSAGLIRITASLPYSNTPTPRRQLRFIWLTLCVLLLAFCSLVEAQQQGKVHRLGILRSTSSNSTATRESTEALRQGLRQLGWIDGQNIALEQRHAEGKFERLPPLALELTHFPVDVIYAGDFNSALAAKQATKSIPIVFVTLGDAVQAGLVASLSYPGGNLTGVSGLGPELSGKRLELLKEVVPGLTRVAFLTDPANMASAPTLRATEAAAQSLGVDLQVVKVTKPDQLEDAFSAMKRSRANALMVNHDPTLRVQRDRVLDLVKKGRLAAIYVETGWVPDGGLMSYAPNLPHQNRRAAYFVDRILKGAKPADLPVEQPTKFELAINLKAAKQIGLTIPPNVLARADRVIK